MFVIILWFILSFVVASMGTDRKIGYGTLLLICLFLSPLVGLIFALASDKKKTSKDYELELLQLHSMLEKGIVAEESFERRKADLLELIKNPDGIKVISAEDKKANESLTKFYIIAIAAAMVLLLLVILFNL